MFRKGIGHQTSGTGQSQATGIRQQASGKRPYVGRTDLWSAAVLALLLLARSASAQTPAIPKVEFDDAIQRAVANNPTVAQAAVAIPRAEALVAQARALTRPTASAAFGNTTLDSARGFAGGITQPQNQSSLSGDVTVPLLNLSRWANVSQARDQVEIAQISTANVRRDIAVATAQTYLAVLAARRQVDDMAERLLSNPVIEDARVLEVEAS